MDLPAHLVLLGLGAGQVGRPGQQDRKGQLVPRVGRLARMVPPERLARPVQGQPERVACKGRLVRAERRAATVQPVHKARRGQPDPVPQVRRDQQARRDCRESKDLPVLQAQAVQPVLKVRPGRMAVRLVRLVRQVRAAQPVLPAQRARFQIPS